MDKFWSFGKKSIKLIYGEATISSKKNALKNDTLFLNACLQKIDSWLRQDIKGKILNEPLSILDSEYNKCLGCIQKIYHTICEAFFFPSVMKLHSILINDIFENFSVKLLLNNAFILKFKVKLDQKRLKISLLKY